MTEWNVLLRHRKMRIVLFLFILIFSKNAVAQPKYKTGWKAQWIGLNNFSYPNSFYRFRKEFKLKKVPQNASFSIAVDSKYWLWINGTLVVFEGELKRGPAPDATYFDTLNIAKFLKQGTNTMAILVWFWGCDGYCHKNSGKAGLLCQVDMQEQSVISDDSWQVLQDNGFQNSLPPYPNYRLPEFNIHFDARLSDFDWIKPSFNTGGWQPATVLGAAGGAPWGRLCLRPVPLWFDSGLVPYQDTMDVDGGIKALLPKNITITPWFSIEAPAGLLIDIRTDNYYGGSEPNIRTEYVTKAGVQEFETLAYMNGHYVMYTFPPGVKVLDLKYRETRYNTQHIGFFTCEDSFLNRLWQKSLNTMNVNMRDAIQDADRERSQWWGDAVIILEEILYSCDSNGVKIIQKAISNLLEWQRPDSALFSPVPAGKWNRELPSQMLASIGKYGIWNYIKFSGDTAMIRYVYPFLKKYMAKWKVDDTGLVIHRTGEWSWYDWGNDIDTELLDNAWYYMALESCLNMAHFLAKQDDAAAYQDQMNRLKSAFQKYFWKGDRFAGSHYPLFADDRGNGLAVCAGLVTAEQWRKMKPNLDTIFHAGPYMEKYILESYFLMGSAEDGIQRMKNRYARMVNDSIITTLWEGWEINSAVYGGGSYNHGWAGGPLSLLSGYVGGIHPDDPGFKSYRIRPQTGHLKHVDVAVPTPKGMITLRLNLEKNKTLMTVQTINADAIIAVPKPAASANKYTINNRRLNSFFQLDHSDKQYIYFKTSRAGKWNIVVTR